MPMSNFRCDETLPRFFSFNPDELQGAYHTECNTPCLRWLSDREQHSLEKDAFRTLSCRMSGDSERFRSFDGRCTLVPGLQGTEYGLSLPPLLQLLRPDRPAPPKIRRISPKGHPRCPPRAQPRPRRGFHGVWIPMRLPLLSQGFAPQPISQGGKFQLGFP